MQGTIENPQRFLKRVGESPIVVVVVIVIVVVISIFIIVIIIIIIIIVVIITIVIIITIIIVIINIVVIIIVIVVVIIIVTIVIIIVISTIVIIIIIIIIFIFIFIFIVIIFIYFIFIIFKALLPFVALFCSMLRLFLLFHLFVIQNVSSPKCFQPKMLPNNDVTDAFHLFQEIRFLHIWNGIERMPSATFVFSRQTGASLSQFSCRFEIIQEGPDGDVQEVNVVTSVKV